MSSVIDNFTAYLPSIDRSSVKIRELLIPQAPTNFFQTLHPSISFEIRLSLITLPLMTTVLIRRNAQSDSCHNLTALMPRCTKKIISNQPTPHMCSQKFRQPA